MRVESLNQQIDQLPALTDKEINLRVGLTVYPRNILKYEIDLE